MNKNKIKVTITHKIFEGYFCPDEKDRTTIIVCDERYFQKIIKEFGKCEIEKMIIEDYVEELPF